MCGVYKLKLELALKIGFWMGAVQYHGTGVSGVEWAGPELSNR